MTETPLAHVQPLKLYTFTLSHFSEKARWLLSASHIPFVEVPWTPFFHTIPAFLSGGKSTVPILDVNGQRIQDSTRIMHWLDRNRGPLALLPTDPALRAEALALEDRFDKVGEDVVRYAYRDTLSDKDSVVRYWTLDAPARQRRFLARFYPAVRFVFRRWVGINARSVVRAQHNIDAGLTLIEERLRSGHRYLVGDSFTVADLTAAALLSPLACPDEHPIFGGPRYRAGARSVTDIWTDRPAFVWVREIYRNHREPSARLAEIRAALSLNALPG